jgi:ribonuclease T2
MSHGRFAKAPATRDLACPRRALTPTVLRSALFLLLLLWSHGAGAAEHRAVGAFDHYVLALSWSPTYCASERGGRAPLQCGSGRRYDFVVHGLWPQYRDGWPQYCDAEARLPKPLIAGMLDIMPSRQLVRHQWIKHGTCTGLGPHDYFTLTRRLHDEIRIPARYIDPGRSIEVSVGQFIADFLATNRKLERNMISVYCGNRRDRARLVELRICFSRDGVPRACGGNERRQCRAERLVLPPVR